MPKERVCELLKEMRDEEARAPAAYYRLLDALQEHLPETMNPYFRNAFINAVIEDEAKHRRFLEALSRLVKCGG